MSDTKPPEQEARENLADEIAHDVVAPPGDHEDPSDALARVNAAYAAAYRALAAGGTEADARAAAAKADQSWGPWLRSLPTSCGTLLDADLARASGEISCRLPRGHGGRHLPAPGSNAGDATVMALADARAELDRIRYLLDTIALGQRHASDPGDWIFCADAIRAGAALREARTKIEAWP